MSHFTWIPDASALTSERLPSVVIEVIKQAMPGDPKAVDVARALDVHLIRWQPWRLDPAWEIWVYERALAEVPRDVVPEGLAEAIYREFANFVLLEHRGIVYIHGAAIDIQKAWDDVASEVEANRAALPLLHLPHLGDQPAAPERPPETPEGFTAAQGWLDTLRSPTHMLPSPARAIDLATAARALNAVMRDLRGEPSVLGGNRARISPDEFAAMFARAIVRSWRAEATRIWGDDVASSLVKRFKILTGRDEEIHGNRRRPPSPLVTALDEEFGSSLD